MKADEITRYLEGDLKEQVIPCLGVTSRYAQISLGTEWGRVLINPDLWANTWGKGMEGGESVMNDSVRFPNEEDVIRSLGGFTILIVRPGTKPVKFKWGWIGEMLYDWFGVMWGAHDSERTDRLKPDFTIHNDSSVEQMYADIDAAMAHWEAKGRTLQKVVSEGLRRRCGRAEPNLMRWKQDDRPQRHGWRPGAISTTATEPAARIWKIGLSSATSGRSCAPTAPMRFRTRRP